MWPSSTPRDSGVIPRISPSTNQGYHWNRNAETYYLIGQSMAAEMQTLIESAGGNDFSDWIGGYPGVGGQTGLDDDPDGDGSPTGWRTSSGRTQVRRMHPD